MEMERLTDEDKSTVDDYGTISTGRSDDKKPILFDDRFVVSLYFNILTLCCARRVAES